MLKVATLCLALLLIPTVGAQTELFSDDDGDVMLSTQDGSVSQPDASGNYKNVDVVSAGIWAEDDDFVIFYIEVDDLTESSQVPLPFSDPDYYLYFNHGEQGYRVMVATALDNPTNAAFGRDGSTNARLDREVDNFRFSSIAQVDVEMDYSENMVLISVPRGALVDHNQAPLARNSTLSEVFIESKSMGWFGFPIPIGGSGGGSAYVGIPQAWDRGPDDDYGMYQMTTGTIQQRGTIFAVSDDPVRWTNGEATTLKFEVKVTNLGSTEVSTAVKLDQIDASWDAAYSDRLTIPAQGSINTTILVSIPFSHLHGTTHLFSTTFESDDGKHQATAVLGVHWPEIPQPAGHHNRIWFHSLEEEVMPPFDAAFSGIHGWFSAKEDVDADTGAALLPDFTVAPGMFGAQEGRAIWYLRLEPALRMGLDFMDGGVGSLELGINLPVPAYDAQVTVEVIHSKTIGNPQRGGIGGGNGGNTVTETLMSGQSELVAGVVSGAADFEFELHLADGVKTIPYDPAANLVIMVDLQATFLFGTGFVSNPNLVPSLDTGSSMVQLPLNEYHDPADLTFNTDASVNIIVGEAGQERFVNPGRTIVYTFELDFMGDAATNFQATLSGRNVAWGQIIGDSVFDLEAGTKRQLAIAVTAPKDVRDGDQADISLTIRSVKNSAIQAGVQTLTTVTSAQDIPDESELMNELSGELTKEEESPGLGALLIGSVLIGVALRRRRQ